MSEILSIGELLDLGNSAATAGLIPYSALEYNGSGSISGISGSAIAGGVDSAAVSSIVSSYVSSKVDKSAFDNCCSSVQSALSGKLDASASGQFAPSGDYYSASNPSGFIISANLSSKLDASASSQFQPSGNYAYNSSLTSYIPFSSVSGTDSKISAINGSAIAGSMDSAVVSSIVSSYVASSVSGKADKSALDNCCSAMSAVVSAKANTSALTSYVPYSALKHGPTTATISAIGNSAVYDSSAHARVNTLSTTRIPYSAIEYAAGTQSITGISGSAIIGGSLPTTELVVNPAQMSAAVSAGNIVIGLKTNVYTPVLIVQNSADATASNVIYVVTGNA